MNLTLRAVSLNDQRLSQPITAYFDADGGSVGRGDHNTLALPDPDRHISRQQAEISLNGATYRIKNVGSANPIIVRGQSLKRGDSLPLAHRDQVQIGGYLLEVIQEQMLDIAGDTVVQGRAAVGADSPSGATPRGDLDMQGSHCDPCAKLPGNPGGVSSTPAARTAHGSLARPAPPRPPVHALLPEDFDPFAPPAASNATPVTSHARDPAGLFGDLIPSTQPRSLDDAFGLRGDGEHDPLAGFLADAPLPPNGAPGASTDPFAMFHDAPEARPAPGPTLADDVPALHTPFVPPRWEATDRVAVPSVRTEPGPSEAPGSPGLWAAFCEGAEMSNAAGTAPGPETMRTLGALLRAAVAGTLQLMSVRAIAKHELRAEVTVIQSRNNNPLKFSPDASSALEQMLQPPLRGFLAGPEAMTDAMQDLVGHAIGTMAGTRAALDGMLDRFSPRQLESQLVGHSVLDSLLPMNRKAKLWELYLRHFDVIRGEAQDDFHTLFGRAFLAAYEQQLDRLKQAPR